MPLDIPPPVDAVVVTAARLPAPLADAAFSIARVDGEDLARASRVDEAITATPGVSLFRRTSSLSANPTTQGVSLRGIAPSGAGRALVLLDGVPLNDPFGGWVIWSQLAPSAVSGADIVRGAGAGPYGAGALTGVISLRERDAGGAFELARAQRGEVDASGDGVVKLGQAQVYGALSFQDSDGYTPVRGPARGAADTKTSLTTRSASVRVDAPTGLGTLSVRASTFDDKRGAGLAGANANASGDILSATLAQAPRGRRPGWRLQVWRQASDLFNSSVAVAANRASTTPANSQDRTPAVGEGANLAIRLQSGALQWEVGADARRNKGEERERFRYLNGAYNSQRTAGGETSVAGVYVDGAWQAGTWLVAGGLRADHWESRGGYRVERSLITGALLLNETPADRQGDLMSFRLGARKTLEGGATLRAAAYSGFRPPTLNELHRPFRVGNDVTESNPNLKPEALKGLELGFGRDGATGRGEVTVFWNRIEDAIANVTIGVGPGTFPRAGFIPAGGVLRQRLNISAIEAVGVEGQARREVAGVVLRAAFAVTDARVVGAGLAPQLEGKRPAQAPIWSATAGLTAPLAAKLSLDLDVTYEGKRFEDDLNSRILSPAAKIDARLEWRPTPHARIYLAADNLLDKNVEVSRTVDGIAGLDAPRTVRLGIGYSY